MTLIELFDPHELAFPLVGQLEENFEIEVINEIPKDLNKHKNNLLIIVGKNFAELEQYKILREYYLAIVVFIKDMEATQIRTLQSTEETFDAFFGIPWQKTALKFYLQDLAEYKAMELKDELELTDTVKGNETKSAILQNLFDQAPDDGSLVTSSIDTTEKTDESDSDGEDELKQTANQHDKSDSGIHLDLSSDDSFEDNSKFTSTETEVDMSSSEEIDNSNDIELDLSDDNIAMDDIAEEDSEEDLFGLDDESVELDFSDGNEDSKDESSASDARSSSDDMEFGDDDLDFAVHSELDNISTTESSDAESKVTEDNQPSLSLSEDAVEKLKEIDKILDNDSLSESSINEIAEEDSLDLSLSSIDDESIADEDESSESGIGEISLNVDMDDELDFSAEDQSESIDEIALNTNDAEDAEEYTLAEESDLLDNKENEEAGTMMIGGTQIAELSTPDEMDFEVDEEPSEPIIDNSHDLAAKESFHKPEQKEVYQKEIASFDGDLERAGAIISELRSERDYLEKRLNELEKEKVLKERSNLDMRAELSEKTIELQLIKKRHQVDISQFHQKLSAAEEARQLAANKKKFLEDEVRKLQSQMNFDVKKIKSRERELEDRIDLIKQDAEVQIRNRDSSIIDLKRKIDMLEFNLDNAIEKDKFHIETKFELESKVDKVMQTLRNAIGVLEDDIKNGNADDAGDNSNG